MSVKVTDITMSQNLLAQLLILLVMRQTLKCGGTTPTTCTSSPWGWHTGSPLPPPATFPAPGPHQPSQECKEFLHNAKGAAVSERAAIPQSSSDAVWGGRWESQKLDVQVRFSLLTLCWVLVDGQEIKSRHILGGAKAVVAADLRFRNFSGLQLSFQERSTGGWQQIELPTAWYFSFLSFSPGGNFQCGCFWKESIGGPSPDFHQNIIRICVYQNFLINKTSALFNINVHETKLILNWTVLKWKCSF